MEYPDLTKLPKNKTDKDSFYNKNQIELFFRYFCPYDKIGSKLEMSSKLLLLNQNKITYNMDIQDPWFTNIKNGKKTIEGRKRSPSWINIKQGDIVLIEQKDKNSFYVIVTKVNHYLPQTDCIKQYLLSEGLLNTLPGITNIDKGVEIYEEFWKKTGDTLGVLAIYVKKLKVKIPRV